MDTKELFERGLAQLREGNRLGALASFEKAYETDKSATLQSYIGFCIAWERGQVTEGLRMCREAIAMEPDPPVHYLNLARAYMKPKRKDDALDTLRLGLSHGEDPEIRQMLSDLGVRRKPLLPFLARGNFMNRYLGLLIARLKAW